MNIQFLSDRLDDLQNRNYYNPFNKIPVLTAVETIATDLDFNVSGTNAVSTSFALAAAGGITGTTTAAANDQVILGPATTAGITGLNVAGVFATDNRPAFECAIKTGASIASTRIWAGLKLTSTSIIATDADAAFFIYDQAVDTNWRFVLAVGGVVTSYTMPSIAPFPVAAANTVYQMRIAVQPDRSVQADLWVNTLSNTNATGDHWTPSIPAGSANLMTTAVNLKPFIGVQTLTTAAKAHTIKYIRLQSKHV